MPTHAALVTEDLNDSDKPHLGANARTGIGNNRWRPLNRAALSRLSGQWRECKGAVVGQDLSAASPQDR
jgi:hypothetical protein